jgi:hypothetical protein
MKDKGADYMFAPFSFSFPFENNKELTYHTKFDKIELQLEVTELSFWLRPCRG